MVVKKPLSGNELDIVAKSFAVFKNEKSTEKMRFATEKLRKD